MILEPSGRATVLNEPGPSSARATGSGSRRSSPTRLAHHGVLVCSGSLPPGAPPDGYGRLVAIAHDAGGPRWSTPTARRSAARSSQPDVVTPNLAEAEGLLHGRGDEPVEASPDARPRALRRRRSCVDAARDRPSSPRPRQAPPSRRPRAASGRRAPAWTVRNPIGAGDVLTSALAAALERGEPSSPRCARGVAAAAAAVESPKAGVLDPARMRELLAATAIEPALTIAP